MALVPLVALLILLVAIQLSLGVAIRRWRRGQTRIIIEHAAFVVGQNLPLATGIRLAADSERGYARESLKKIHGWLSAGAPFSKALKASCPNCPALVTSLLSAADEVGQLPEALSEMERTMRAQARQWKPVSKLLGVSYYLIVTAAILLVLFLVAVFIMPRMTEIFDDFSVSLPPLTILVLGSVPALEVFAPLLPIILIVVFVAWGYVWTRPRRPDRPRLLSRVGDWLKWHIPFWRRAEFGEGMARLIEVVRFGLRAGAPLEQVARLATTVDVNRAMQNRACDFAERIQSGQQPHVAAKSCKLGQVFSRALTQPGGREATNRALNHARDYYRAVGRHPVLAFAMLFLPFVTLVMGFCVATVVLALFLPLITLIESLVS